MNLQLSVSLSLLASSAPLPSPRAPEAHDQMLRGTGFKHYCTHSRFDTFCLTKGGGLIVSSVLSSPSTHPKTSTL